MKRSTRLKKYVELFKRNINQFLAPDVDIKTTIYPVEAEGAVFEFVFNRSNDSTETVEKIRPTVGSVLSKIPQRLVTGNIEGIKFGGTNLFLEGDRILVIKGEDDPESWSGTAIIEDVKRVVSSSQGGKTA
jgi:hypothetical protein|tara:strand:- start:607 stop:999 length:393 start_codon:yes stop_codon:yes gene_type:complete